MKTTIDISDNLLAQAKKLAHEQHLTLRSLVEEGLGKVLEESAKRTARPVKPVVFGGSGLSPEFQEVSWQDIRNAAYEGHGS